MIAAQSMQTNEENPILGDLASQESPKITRKFINSAIYVEKPLSATVSAESCASRKISSEDLLANKTKRCTCSINKRECLCHKNNFEIEEPQVKKCSTSTKKSKVVLSKVPNSGKLLRNADYSVVHLKKWATKRIEEKKEKQIEVKVDKDKEMLLEQERNNFKNWLMDKKKKEMEEKRKKQKQSKDEQLRELEKEKKQLENELNYQLWLKKKEEQHLEKKIQKELLLINELQRKEHQIKENERAFSEWLKNSKNKQKPLPLNRGLESLCSSTSVTYVNPKPWNSMP